MLEAFMPLAGHEYSRTRNYDFGRNHRLNVFGLSPWVSLRVIPEWELIAEVLQHHSAAEASKFIDEVCWRTYWIGERADLVAYVCIIYRPVCSVVFYLSSPLRSVVAIYSVSANATAGTSTFIHTQAGFFRFKKAIPEAIDHLAQ